MFPIFRVQLEERNVFVARTFGIERKHVPLWEDQELLGKIRYSEGDDRQGGGVERIGKIAVSGLEVNAQ
jgi:hypothetical protein